MFVRSLLHSSSDCELFRPPNHGLLYMIIAKISEGKISRSVCMFWKHKVFVHSYLHSTSTSEIFRPRPLPYQVLYLIVVLIAIIAESLVSRTFRKFRKKNFFGHLYLYSNSDSKHLGPQLSSAFSDNCDNCYNRQCYN